MRFRVLGFRGLGFRGLGFKGFRGFRGLGVWGFSGLGFGCVRGFGCDGHIQSSFNVFSGRCKLPCSGAIISAHIPRQCVELAF